MKGYLTQLLLSVSLAALCYCAPSASKTLSTARNKVQRSFHTDQAHRHHSRLGKKPWPLGGILDKSKRNGLDTLDFDSILNDPFFMDLGEPSNNDHHDNGFDLDLDEASLGSMLPVKDRMSNVIPGAQGPFDPPPRPGQYIAGDMLEEFTTFLTMKEMGMLDMCLGFRKRR